MWQPGSPMRTVLFLLLLVFPVITGCRPAAVRSSSPAAQRWDLLDEKHAPRWQQAGIPDEGKITVEKGEITLLTGLPMTGCKFASWTELGLPGSGYRITYEALRVEGEDIFGMCTFPVASHETHATFVLGGWGGTLTGISSIDFKDASENSTRAEQRFADGVWHRVKIEVRAEDIQAWVNDKLVVNVSIKGRKVSLRPGFIDHCLPFGFATWNTTAKVRGVVVESLK